MKIKSTSLVFLASFFLAFSSILFSDTIARKEVRVFDTFENFVKNIPIREYQTESEYNADKQIKNDNNLIKVFKEKTADGRTVGTGFLIPPYNRDKYPNLYEYGFKEANTTKKMVAAFNTLDNLFRKKALKIYKSDACETNYYNDTILTFKHIPNLIKVTYFYNLHSDSIYQTEHRIPVNLLDAYLQQIANFKGITPKQAEQLRQKKDQYITFKYDYQDRYVDEAREQALEKKYNRQALANNTTITASSMTAPTEQKPVSSYYFHKDAQGSVTAVTDHEGKLIERVTYGVYGAPTFWDYTQDPNNPVKRSRSVIGNDILFQGRRYDYERIILFP